MAQEPEPQPPEWLTRRLPQRILISEIHGLGDAVMCAPALEAARERFPEAYIAFQTQAAWAPLFAEDPHIDEVIAYEKGGRHAGIRGRLRHVRELRRRRFDLGILLDRGERMTYIAWLAGIPRLIAYTGASNRGLRNNPFFGWVLDADLPDTDAQELHRAHGHLRLLGMLGCDPRPRPIRLHIGEARRAAGRKLLDDALSRAGHRPGEAAVVAMHPGASWVDRRWPPGHFVALSQLLLAEGFAPVLLGGRHEQAELDAIRAACPQVPWLETAGIEQLAVVIANCAAFVANDSGPMHLASALGTPLVALMGANTPDTVGPCPLNPRAVALHARMPCCPCPQDTLDRTARCLRPHGKWCMEEITPAMALEAVHTVLHSDGQEQRRAVPA